MRVACNGWVEPARREPSLLGADCFQFLNEEHALSVVGWDDERLEKLWRYNLHYFDDLNARGARARAEAHRTLIDRWVDENPPAAGTGWESYPTSLRIVNWIKWFLQGAVAEPAWLNSLACQARWLSGRLEWHLLGNHLFVNAKALIMAGLFFAGAEAQRWLEIGRSILTAELDEQILRDGGQFERSPMYHALAVEDVLDLVNALRCFDGDSRPGLQGLRAQLEGLAPSMLAWMRAMTFSDGSLTHFNDSADGIAPTLAELERYSAGLGIDLPALHSGDVYLADSGYARLARGSAKAWLDVGPIGPSYLPGHAHADSLSFELEVHGRKLLLNGGTSLYGVSRQRLIERGTARHNTVQVAGRDSSEVWGGFRVGRRARVFDVQATFGRVEAAHDGYRFLPGRPIHRRVWTLDDRELVVDDRITPARADGQANFHFAPGVVPVRSAEDTWELRCDGRGLGCVVIEHAAARLVESEHAPQFGVVQPTFALSCDMPEGRCTSRWIWEH